MKFLFETRLTCLVFGCRWLKYNWRFEVKEKKQRFFFCAKSNPKGMFDIENKNWLLIKMYIQSFLVVISKKKIYWKLVNHSIKMFSNHKEITNQVNKINSSNQEKSKKNKIKKIYNHRVKLFLFFSWILICKSNL